jgi:hypothetical protein
MVNAQVIGYDNTFNFGTGEPDAFIFNTPQTTGILGVEDYEVESSLLPCDGWEAFQIIFVFQTLQTGNIRFDFFDEDGNFSSAFAVGLPATGFFQWVINFPPGFEFPTTGTVVISTNIPNATAGRLAFTDRPPLVGSTDGNIGESEGIPFDDAFGPDADAYMMLGFTGFALPDAPIITAPADVTCSCGEGINPNPANAEVIAGCDGDFGFEVRVEGPVINGLENCPGTQYVYTYIVEDDFGGTSSDTQIYTIANDGPELICPDDVVINCEDGDQNAVIEAWIETVSATASCGLDGALPVINTYNSNFVFSCINNGFNTISFFTQDNCGRTANCSAQVIIVDTEPPVFVSEPEELLIPCTANTQQIFNDWLANHGGAEVYDCQNNVFWSASVGPNALNCANGPQAIVVDFTATDGCGNSATTTGIFNTKLLPNAVNVSGSIQTEAAEAVAQVQVAAYSSNGAVMNMSTDEGAYNFEELPFEENTEIVPAREGDWLNGVTTFDLLILQQHILSTQELDSPYKRIAADVNNSGTISTLDLVLLRRLILTIDTELADNTSWRFIDADFVFPNPENPFEADFPEAYVLSGEEEELVDFVAIKIGDLNLDAETYNFGNTSDDRSGAVDLNLTTDEKLLTAGEMSTIDLSLADVASLQGLQFTLEFDPSLVEVTGINSDVLDRFSAANYATHLAEDGKITVSWNDINMGDISADETILSISINAFAQVNLSEVLSINSSVVRAEAYQDGSLSNLNLSFLGANTAANQFELYQNQPNPFREATMIGFSLPEASSATLTIYDVNGKVLKVIEGDYSAGYHNLTIPQSELSANGVMYYQLATKNETITKTMVSMK